MNEQNKNQFEPLVNDEEAGQFLRDASRIDADISATGVECHDKSCDKQSGMATERLRQLARFCIDEFLKSRDARVVTGSRMVN